MKKSSSVSWFEPDWPMPEGVHSLVTTRLGGFSQAPYDSLNLGVHVGDDPVTVQNNRQKLFSMANLPSHPIWLNQVHGTHVWSNKHPELLETPTADGAVSSTPKQVLAIMTADCLPVLFAHQNGRVIGAAHAGWRGLCDGVLENTIDAMLKMLSEDSQASSKNDIFAWLGPAIGQTHFEVGAEVREAFLLSANNQLDIENCFISNENGKYFADLHGLALLRLKAYGISHVYGKPHCCFDDKAHFYSYRRDKTTGRFASLIWMD